MVYVNLAPATPKRLLQSKLLNNPFTDPFLAFFKSITTYTVVLIKINGLGLDHILFEYGLVAATNSGQILVQNKITVAHSDASIYFCKFYGKLNIPTIEPRKGKRLEGKEKQIY